MKNLKKMMLCVSVLLVIVVLFSSCKKDKNPEGYTPFGSEGGNEIVAHEKYINEHRGNLSHPEDCDAIALLGKTELIAVFYGEMIKELDGFTTKATAIYRNDKYYDKWYSKDLTRSKLIRKLGDEKIVDYDVRRVLSYYSRAMKDKALEYVVDGICFGGGTRNQWTDDRFQNMFTDTIASYIEHDSWKVVYNDEIYYYYFYYAVNPANYAEGKKMGMPTPTIREMIALYPRELIQSFETLQAFRQWSLTQADYSKGKFPAEYAKIQKE